MSKKLDQTKVAKEEFASPLLEILDTEKKYTYQELKDMLNKDRRTVRQMISDLSMYYPVVSTSKEQGHRLAKRIDTLNNADDLVLELKQVAQAASEIMSRINILKGKLKPLIAWQKVAEKKLIEMTK